MKMKMKAEGQDSIPQVSFSVAYVVVVSVEVMHLLWYEVSVTGRFRCTLCCIHNFLQSERVYYEVQLPKEYKLPNMPMFFSKVRV